MIYNNPEYQKTAKQVYGEAIGVAAETLGWGKVGNIAKTVKASSVAQTVLRSAGTGAVFGGTTATGRALEDDKSGKEILKSAAIGTVTGAATGAALGYVSGKIGGKISKKEATKLASPNLNKAEREAAAKAGRLKPRTFLRSEKYTPSAKDKELGKVIQEAGLKGKNLTKDINKANKELGLTASELKKLLKEKGGIYNKNTIKGQLNKMKSDKTVDLIDAEVKVYDKMIAKFNKLADKHKNKGLDGLLEVRQQFDSWAKSNNPNIFNNKTGGSYRALTSVRDTINSYLNKQAKDNIVKISLKKQTNLYRIIENLAEKAATRGKQLQPSKLSRPLRKALGYGAAAAGGAYLFGKKGGGGGSGYVDISSFTE